MLSAWNNKSIIPAFGRPLDDNNSLSQGLVGWWCVPWASSIKEACYDWSGHGNNGSPSSSLSLIQGPNGNAINFNDASISIPNSSSLNPNSFSICFWFNVNTGNGRTWFSKGTTFSSYRSAASSVVINASIGSKSISVAGLLLNTWYFCCTTFVNGVFSLYVNGVLISSVTGASLVWTNDPLILGGSQEIGKHFGYMFYNRALSSQEFQQLYKQTNPYQQLAPPNVLRSQLWNFKRANSGSIATWNNKALVPSFGGYLDRNDPLTDKLVGWFGVPWESSVHGMLANWAKNVSPLWSYQSLSPTIISNGKNGNALSQNSNNFIVSGQANPVNETIDFSVSFWFKRTSLVTTNNAAFIGDGDSQSTAGFWIRESTSSLQLLYGWSTSYANIGYRIALNTPYFATLAFKGTTAYFYLNGVFIGSISTGVRIQSPSYLYLFSCTTNHGYGAVLWNLMFHQRALSGTDHQSLYNQLNPAQQLQPPPSIRYAGWWSSAYAAALVSGAVSIRSVASASLLACAETLSTAAIRGVSTPTTHIAGLTGALAQVKAVAQGKLLAAAETTSRAQMQAAAKSIAASCSLLAIHGRMSTAAQEKLLAACEVVVNADLYSEVRLMRAVTFIDNAAHGAVTFTDSASHGPVIVGAE
jgi:hypothetical protein